MTHHDPLPTHPDQTGTTRPRRRRRTARRGLGALAAAAVMTCALAVAPERADAAGLLVADGGFGGVLEIPDHDVEVTINNGIAVTSVTQVFRNTEDRQLEALYTFPVPRGASVSDFSMWINGKEMVGEVVERRRAREIYESYKAQRIDPGLLEQVDHSTFEMRIFPIAPRGEQRVRIVYYQELEVDRDWATYVYPLATETRQGVDARTTGSFSLSLTTKSEVPIATIESPSHEDDFAMAKHTPNLVQASLEATGGDLSRDVVVAYQLSRPRTGLDVVASKEPGEDGYFQLTLTAGDELAKEDAGADYVFVLDVSGSMRNDGKLAVSRGSLDAFIRALGPTDRFELMAFNVQPMPLFRELSKVDEAQIEQAVAFLGGQRPRGGTSLGAAIQSAYRYRDDDRQLNVVVLSDGMTEKRERGELLRLIQARPSGTRVFAIGVGNDVDRPLLQQIAEEAGGLASFVSRGDNMERRAAAFRRKLMRPAIASLRIEADEGGLFDVEPRQLPNLYDGVPVVMYGRYAKPGPVTLVVTGDLAGEPFEQRIEMKLAGNEANNPEIERMWASRRVERLQREAARAGEPAAVVDEIVRLGEGYSIVTPYTSFLVLENDAEYQRWKIERRNVTRVGRDRVAQQRVREELTAMRDEAMQRIGPQTETANADEAAKPARKRPTVNSRTQSSRQGPPTQSGRESRNVDLVFPRLRHGSGGGGALDPVSVGLVLMLGGIGVVARRRRRTRA